LSPFGPERQSGPARTVRQCTARHAGLFVEPPSGHPTSNPMNPPRRPRVRILGDVDLADVCGWLLAQRTVTLVPGKSTATSPAGEAVECPEMLRGA